MGPKKVSKQQKRAPMDQQAFLIRNWAREGKGETALWSNKHFSTENEAKEMGS